MEIKYNCYFICYIYKNFLCDASYFLVVALKEDADVAMEADPDQELEIESNRPFIFIDNSSQQYLVHIPGGKELRLPGSNNGGCDDWTVEQAQEDDGTKVFFLKSLATPGVKERDALHLLQKSVKAKELTNERSSLLSQYRDSQTQEWKQQRETSKKDMEQKEMRLEAESKKMELEKQQQELETQKLQLKQLEEQLEKAKQEKADADAAAAAKAETAQAAAAAQAAASAQAAAAEAEAAALLSQSQEDKENANGGKKPTEAEKKAEPPATDNDKSDKNETELRVATGGDTAPKGESAEGSEAPKAPPPKSPGQGAPSTEGPKAPPPKSPGQTQSQLQNRGIENLFNKSVAAAKSSAPKRKSNK